MRKEEAMRNNAVLDLPDRYHRSGTARRALTLAPIVPSQDVSRFQASDMPKPTYDLDRKDDREFLNFILFAALALVVTGAGIVLIQRIGVWLAP
jgi:hypothetical protein